MVMSPGYEPGVEFGLGVGSGLELSLGAAEVDGDGDDAETGVDEGTNTGSVG